MKGHPILGTISGFLFGLFLGVTLFMYGAIPLHSPLLWILPLVGIVLGLAMAAWAPFGSGSTPQPATSGGITYASGDTSPAQTSGTTLEQEAVPSPPDSGTSEDGAEDHPA
jgi:hypothetical protein